MTPHELEEHISNAVVFTSLSDGSQRRPQTRRYRMADCLLCQGYEGQKSPCSISLSVNIRELRG